MKAISGRRRPYVLSWLLVAGLVTGVTALWVAAGGRSTPAQAQANAMAIDVIPGGGVDYSMTVTGTVPFDVDVLITQAGTPYAGYDSILEFDPSILALVGHSYLATDIFNLCADATTGTGRVNSGCARSTGTTTFTGGTDRISFQCIGQGTSALHLVPPEGNVTHTSMLGAGGTLVPTALSDAQITCGEGGGPVPSPSGTSPTPQSPGPTPTPLGPQPTPTPLPPGFEAVPLAAGCNPVTSTYPDATPIQTLSDAVGPAGNLVSLWEFDVGTWRAFSPQYPQASDLTEANLLDVVFACVGGPGDFVRRIV